MGILDRYIARIWVRLLLLCLSGFVGIYLVIDFIEKIPRFLRDGGAAADILQYFIWKFPEMISRTATFSVLMATLLTLGALSRDSEIVAMRSSGISLPRLSLPMLVLGFITSIMLLINAELLLPHSYARTEQIDPEASDFADQVADLVRDAVRQPKYQFQQPPQPVPAHDPAAGQQQPAQPQAAPQQQAQPPQPVRRRRPERCRPGHAFVRPAHPRGGTRPGQRVRHRPARPAPG